MDLDTSVFSQLKQSEENFTQVLDTCVEVILKEKNFTTDFSNLRKGLSYSEKVLISKLITILKRMATLQKQDLLNALASVEKVSPEIKKYLNSQVFPNIYFQRTLNNYTLIKFHIDREKSVQFESQVIEQRRREEIKNIQNFIFDASKIEWKLEVTLSSIKLKKVVRPLILLTVHTKQGIIKSFYMDINQFQEFRKNLAMILKHIHQIELK